MPPLTPAVAVETAPRKPSKSPTAVAAPKAIPDEPLAKAHSADDFQNVLDQYERLVNSDEDPDGEQRARIIKSCLDLDDGILALNRLLALTRCAKQPPDPMLWTEQDVARKIFERYPQIVEYALNLLKDEESPTAAHLLFSGLLQHDLYDDDTPGSIDIRGYSAACSLAYTRTDNESLRAHMLGSLANVPGLEDLGVDMMTDWLRVQGQPHFPLSVLQFDQKLLLKQLEHPKGPEMARLREDLCDSIESSLFITSRPKAEDLLDSCRMLILLGEKRQVRAWLSNPPNALARREKILQSALDEAQPSAGH